VLAAVVLWGFLTSAGPSLAGANDAQWLSQATDSELAFSAWYDGKELVGRFAKFDVRVELDAVRNAPRALTVEVEVGTADMKDREINQELAEPDWFDSRSFPVAVFTSREISQSEGGFLAAGVLRLKGIEQAVAIPLTWQRDGDTATLSGSVVVSRSAWRVGAGEWSSDASLADRVEVRYRVVLAPGE
jgi:polyisoprenoid-binding protein YceI